MKNFLFLTLTLSQIVLFPLFSDNHFTEDEEEEIISEQEIIFDEDND